MNVTKIFNDKEVDELIFLDIDATIKDRVTDIDFIEKIADECYMPFTVGGGISTINQIRDILKAGAEKVSINTSAINNPQLITESSKNFGSQSIVVSIDIIKRWHGKKYVASHSATKKTDLDPIQWAKEVERYGAGEILLNCVYQEGTMSGYDNDLVEKIASSVSIPVIACGGAGKIEDINSLFKTSKVSAAAAGSLFVFHGPRKAVLINYPDPSERVNLYQ